MTLIIVIDQKIDIVPLYLTHSLRCFQVVDFYNCLSAYKISCHLTYKVDNLRLTGLDVRMFQKLISVTGPVYQAITLYMLHNLKLTSSSMYDE